MSRSPQRPVDPPAVTKRAAMIAAAGHTQHWLVGTAYDLNALCRGWVTQEVLVQAVQLFHRAVGESHEAYVARLEDAAELVPKKESEE